MNVSPGEFLGIEEEFAAGKGVFISNGSLYALVAGTKVISPDKTLSVAPTSPTPHQIAKGEVVFAKVAEIFEPVALLQILPVESKSSKQNPVPGYSVIHASRIRPGYVELVHDEMRIGDIVKASVEDIRLDGEISLSTKSAGLGVIEAFCSRCRNPLALRGQKLECDRCGNVERRYLSSEYAIKR